MTTTLQFDSKAHPGMVVVKRDSHPVGFICKIKDPNPKKVPMHTHTFLNTSDIPASSFTGTSYEEVRNKVRDLLR